MFQLIIRFQKLPLVNVVFFVFDRMFITKLNKYLFIFLSHTLKFNKIAKILKYTLNNDYIC